MSEKWYLAGKEFFLHHESTVFGGGRGDWGEQDGNSGGAGGGLEVEVQCIGLFP